MARDYGAPLSLEAARLYVEERRRASPPGTPPNDLLSASDVDPIARAQLALEDEAAARARALGASLVVRDTDLVSTVVYARHYYGRCPAWVEAAARGRRADLYLLCDVDLPWVADAQRDRPEGREAMAAEFARALREFGCAWAAVRGFGASRFDSARRAVDELVADRGVGNSLGRD